MYQRSLTNLAKLPKNEVTNILQNLNMILTDCDGVIWKSLSIIENAPNVCNAFRKLGKQVYYVTNNSTRTREQFRIKATEAGFECVKDDIWTASYLAANYLNDMGFKKKVYIVGTCGISKELDMVGISHSIVGPDNLEETVDSYISKFNPDPDIGAVIVGFDPHISYPKMIQAATYLENPDVHFIATNTDERFPVRQNCIVPGSGSMVRAIEVAAERAPIIMGKPSTYMIDAIQKRMVIDPKKTLMIGDRCNTDILFGTRCGFQTLLVLTGVTKLNVVQALKSSQNPEDLCLVPDFYIDSIGDLLPFLK